MSDSEATPCIWAPEQEIGVNEKEYSTLKFLTGIGKVRKPNELVHISITKFSNKL